MIDFNSVLNDARRLSEAWAPELERRVAALEAGTAKTVPWETIRAEALERIGHGDSR
jgi:putative addiction module component (TIGR02574 family)